MIERIRAGLGRFRTQRRQVRAPRKVDDGERITTARRMKADGHTGRDIAKCLGVIRPDARGDSRG